MVIFLLLTNIVTMVYFLLMILSMKINSFCHQEVQNKYMISTNFLEYYGIVGAVPKGWKKTYIRVWEAT